MRVGQERLDLGRSPDAEDPAPGVLYRQGADGVPQGDRLPGPEKDTAAPGGAGGAGAADSALVRPGWQRHLYSANYGDIVWDFLPPDLQERAPRTFFINYSREATLGEELRLLGHREADAYRMEGLGPDGTCFTALCVF